ncbi:MAG: methyltransferase domain-containing protein, partial [Fuerstiella sp.]|nr:methyltransferase domain-containing protein [Fuerstiella sp.]
MNVNTTTTVEPVSVTCPDCMGEMQLAVESSVCASCNREFSIKDGIPVLRQNSETYYGEFPMDEMHKLLEASRSDLEGSIRRYLRNRDAPPRLGEYILGRGRAGWQYLLPVDRDSKVLDLGCGWGTLAWSLAQFCGHVVACDSTLERMQLLGLRRQQDELDNLQLVCAGDSKYLPFPDDSFNAVVVNGVLEWVPSGLPGNPREVQMEFLREVRRVLKPDGCLFLGIENRYAWKTWAMNADGHTDLRFVPWLPRGLAHLYSKMKGKGSYRNYLYGPGQYSRLLADSGFADTQFYVPCPGYHHPTRMIDFQDTDQLEQAFARKEKTVFRTFRQKVKGFLSARFPDAFGMITSDRKRDSYLSRLLSHVREQTGNESGAGANQFTYRMNGEMGIVTVINRSPAKPFILKLPIHKRGLEELRAETAILKQVVEPGHPLGEQKDLFAKVIANAEFGGQEYFVYSILPGVSGDQIS